MKNISSHICLSFTVLIIVTAGCAKQELVKKDEPITGAAVKSATASQDKPKIEVKTAPPVRNELKEASVAKQAQGIDKSAQVDKNLAGALDAIYFAFDSAELSPQDREILAKNAALIKGTAGVKIRIEGNCDERGSDEYNLALGEKRAEAALRYLTTLGIASERLSSISYGKEKPLDKGNNEAAWAKNRRDDFVAVTK